MSSDIKNDSKPSFLVLKWVSGVLLVVALAFTLFINVFLDDFVKNRIVKEVHKSSDGLYALHIEQLDAKFWNGAIAMNDVKLEPDSASFRRLQAKDTSKSIPDVKLHFDSVNISSIRWFSYLVSNRKLEIGTVLLENPQFNIKGKFTEKSGVKGTQRNFLDLLPGIVAAFTGSLRIEEIKVVNGKLSYSLYGKNGIVRQSADHIEVDLKKIVIDTVSNRKALYSNEAYIHLHNYSVTTPDSLHIFKIKHIIGVVHDSSMVLDNLSYYQKDSVKSKYRNDFDITMRKIHGKGIDYGNLFREQKIFIKTMLLDQPAVSLHSSKDPVEEFSKKDSNQTKESILDELVPYLSGSFRIDNLSVDNGRAHYEIENDNLYVLQEAQNIYLDFSRILLDSTKKTKVYAEDAILKLSNFKLYKNHVSKLDVDSIKISWGDSLLSLKNLNFYSKDEDLVNISTPHIEGNGINYMEMLQTKKVDMRSFIIESPVIKMQTKPSDKTSKKKYDSPNTFFQQALGPLADASFKSDRFIINHANLNYSIKGDSGGLQQKIKDVYIDIKKIRIDSSAASKYNFFDSFFMTLSDYELEMKNLNVNLSMSSILLDSKNKKLKMNTILIRQLDTTGKYQRYYFTDSIQNVYASGFDFDRLVKKQQLHIRHLNVDKMKLNLCYDANKSVKEGFVRKMPNELFADMKLYMRIDSLDLKNSYLLYSEKRPGLEEDGIIIFENLNGKVYNFNNDKKLMTDSNPMTLKGNGMLMGHSLVKLKLEMPLLSEKFNLKYKGDLLDTIQINKFNKLFRYSGTEIERGVAYPSSFDIVIVGGVANGEVTFVYKDLKVKMLDKKREEEKKLFSIGANFAVKNSNPVEEGEAPETVTVSAIRNEEDSFFRLLWRAVRSGISETITKSTVYKVDNGDNPK